jgi:hypothetical protein
MERPYWLPGATLTLDSLNNLSEYIWQAGQLSVDASSGLKLVDIAGNRTLGMYRKRPIWGTLAGSSSPYTFTQALDGATPAFTSYPRTGNAYEVNSVSGLAGKVARLHPDGVGAYRFQWVATGVSGYCGCSGIPATLHASLAPLVATYGAPATCTLPFISTFAGYTSACLPCTGGTISPTCKSMRINFSCDGINAFILTFNPDIGSTLCLGASFQTASNSAVASPCGATLAWTGTCAFGTGLTGSFGVTS